MRFWVGTNKRIANCFSTYDAEPELNDNNPIKDLLRSALSK